MKKSELTLEELKKEVENLKKKYLEELAISTTLQERNALLKKINELEIIKKSPNALKRFGQTYLRGLKKTGRMIWKGIKQTSRNLNKNAPEFRELSKGMSKPSQMQPFSPMAKMYLPKSPKSKKSKKKRRKSYPTKRIPNSMAWDLP
jgi:hypothetical protein